MRDRTRYRTNDPRCQQGMSDLPHLGAYDAKVKRIGERIHPCPNGCWLWIGSVTDQGYGTYDCTPAHRLVYEILVGQIPSMHVLHHECEQRRCVNPAHLTPMLNGDHLAMHAAQRKA